MDDPHPAPDLRFRRKASAAFAHDLESRVVRGSLWIAWRTSCLGIMINDRLCVACATRSESDTARDRGVRSV